MAGDWIKMRTNLRTHPKVVRISSALQCDALRVIGALWAVWSIADEHATIIDGAGHLDGYSLDDLSAVIGFPGFAEALARVGWIAECEEHATTGGKCLIFKDFETHNGTSAKTRGLDAARKRAERKSAAVSSSSRKRPESVRENPDAIRTREEKRREDISTKTQDTTSTGVVSSSSPEDQVQKTEQPAAAAASTADREALQVLREHGFVQAEIGEDLRRLVADGADRPLWTFAAQLGRDQGKTLGFVLGVVRNKLADRQRKGEGAPSGLRPDIVPQDWRETRTGIEGRAAELGIGPWDGITEQFPQYKARVILADRQARGEQLPAALRGLFPQQAGVGA